MGDAHAHTEVCGQGRILPVRTVMGGPNPFSRELQSCNYICSFWACDHHPVAGPIAILGHMPSHSILSRSQELRYLPLMIFSSSHSFLESYLSEEIGNDSSPTQA